MKTPTKTNKQKHVSLLFAASPSPFLFILVDLGVVCHAFVQTTSPANVHCVMSSLVYHQYWSLTKTASQTSCSCPESWRSCGCGFVGPASSWLQHVIHRVDVDVRQLNAWMCAWVAEFISPGHWD